MWKKPAVWLDRSKTTACKIKNIHCFVSCSCLLRKGSKTEVAPSNWFVPWYTNLKGMLYQYLLSFKAVSLSLTLTNFCGLLSPDSRRFPGGKLTGIVGLVSEALACDSISWLCFCNFKSLEGRSRGQWVWQYDFYLCWTGFIWALSAFCCALFSKLFYSCIPSSLASHFEC